MNADEKNVVAWAVISVLQALYTIVRMIMTCRDTGVLSVRRYWSRLCFRIFCLIHFVTFPVLYVYDLSLAVITIGYLDELIQIIAYMFLVRSVQDFTSLFDRQIKWISRGWRYIFVIVTLIDLAIDLTGIIRAFSSPDSDPLFWYALCIFLQLIVVCGFVFIPLLMFVVNLLKSVMIIDLRRKVWIVFSLTVVTLIGDIMMSSVQIYRRLQYWELAGPTERQWSTAEVWLRLTITCGFLLIQDCLDWMAKWLLGDESKIISDDVLQVPIISTDTDV